jgi:mannosyltransferase
VAARSGAAEVVVADGTTGLLVPPGDVDALIAALEKLMHDPSAAATMGRRARERAVAEFSLDAEVAGIAKLYSTVRSGGRSGSRA